MTKRKADKPQQTPPLRTPDNPFYYLDSVNINAPGTSARAESSLRRARPQGAER